METQGNVGEDEASRTALAARVRRIHVGTGIAAALWIALAALSTLLVSDRILTGYLRQAAANAEREANAIAGIVDRKFDELAAIPQVLSSNRELRAIVARYNKAGAAFADLPLESRSEALKNDADVASASRRMTQIRGKLNYDLIFVLNAQGIRVVSSDWDLPISLLGQRFDDREYFKAAMADRMGHMFAIGRTTHVPAFFFSASIEETDGPVGAVVLLQTTNRIGWVLEGRQQETLIVDAHGMVVASSRPDFLLHHAGALANAQPDADTLRHIYRQESLRPLALERPSRALHEAQWVVAERPYLVTRTRLTATNYDLVVLNPTDWVATMRPLHYAIGALAALFGALIVLFINRRLTSAERRNHHVRMTAALNEKLKMLNAEKDRYLGIAAHDLRNPLGAIRGLSELMMEGAMEPDEEKEFVRTINRTSDEMLELVNDLLDVSVIESGKLDLNRAEKDLGRLLRQRVDLLVPHARAKQIDVKVAVDGMQRAVIDDARFGQVMDNLVSNAIKFSPAGTTVEVDLRSRNGSFVFSVQDQGPGIPEAERKLLFRSFQKLSARPTGGEKSTGLGLAIVKRIVDAHGGTIEVESATGAGTRFTVTAPRAPAEEAIA